MKVSKLYIISQNWLTDLEYNNAPKNLMLLLFILNN